MFNWDKKIMEHNLDALLAKKHLTECDNEMIDFYTMELNQDFLSKEERQYHKLSKKEILDNLNMNREDLAFYYTTVFPKNIGTQFYNLIEALGPLYTLKMYHEPLQNFSKNKVNKTFIDMSYDIFDSLSNDYSTYLDHIYENKLIKVKKSKDIITYNSCCFCDITNTTGFVYINPNHKYSNESVYNHELTHSLITKLNPPIIINEKLNFMGEAHTIFIGAYTDSKLYEKTKDPNFLISTYNYSLYLRQAISTLYFYQKISQLEHLSINKIKKILETSLNISFNDDESFINYLEALSQADILTNFKYVASSLISVHLLNLDDEKQKTLFNKSLFDKATTVNKLFKLVEFPTKDKYYACDAFNKYELDIHMKVRERK